jgi:hypothetical protein
MRKTTKIAVVGTSVAALMGAGIAYAAWTSTGTGTGTATAGSEGAANLPVTTVAVSDLYPTGNRSQEVTVTNNNPYAVSLDSITVTGITVADPSTCDASAVTAVLADAPLGDHIAAAGTAVHHFTIAMDADAANGCKGQVFTVAYAASGHSVS